MRSFVTKARGRDGSFIPVQIVDLTVEIIINWHQKIQPVIRNSPNRLDRKWNWSHLYRYLPLIERFRGRSLAGFAVLVQNSLGEGIPAGLVLISKGYPALDNHHNQAIYLWFLAAAPMQALKKLKVSEKPQLLEILVDIALVISDAQGYNGRIGLHAADEDGNIEASKLVQYYQTRCKLLSLPLDAGMPTIVRRNDGRYFYTTPLIAQMRMAELDDLR